MNNEIYELLRKDIQRKIGTQIRYGRDCARLSELLIKETGRHISESTIKRFFGIVKSPFQTSKYTLETLVNFLRFDDWYDYLNTYDQSKHQSGYLSSWDNLKKRMMIVTNHSLNSLKLKTFNDTENVISRPFVKDKLKAFMESTKAVSMLVAPDGYGKSTSVIQIVENYFLQNDGTYKDDIVFLIDGGIFFNLYSKNSNIEMLSQLLEFKINSSQEYYFKQNPEERKGRILMIIDNVDEIFFNQHRYHQFVENLMRLIMGNDNGWYKTLLTCRPENLDAFTYQINKNPYLKNIWCDMDFESNNFNDYINIPLFDNKEINELLKIHGLEYDCDYLERENKNVLKIIRYPNVFTQFVKQYKKTNEVSEIILLHSFLNERIYSPPYLEEKITLVDNMLELCELGKETNSIKKNALFMASVNSKLAYDILISYRIIYEYTIPNGLLGNITYVKFNHSQIFEYLLLVKWSQNRPMDINLFYIINEYYTNNIQLRYKLLELFVKILVHENKTEIINQLRAQLKTSSPASAGEQSSGIKNIISILNSAVQEVYSMDEKSDTV